MDTTCTRAAMKKILPTAHWEPRRGTQEQAIAYCKKQDDTYREGPWEIGTPKAQGKRSDLIEIKRKLDEGASEATIADEHFSTWTRSYKALREYKRLKTAKRTWKTEVTVIWGPTETGKSRQCAAEYPLAYWKPEGKWWDGYEGHETVVWDEFYGGCPFEFMLRLCDRYPLTLETKGGTVEFVAKRIIFTSNNPPETWYNNLYDPLKRRIEHVINKT